MFIRCIHVRYVKLLSITTTTKVVDFFFVLLPQANVKHKRFFQQFTVQQRPMFFFRVQFQHSIILCICIYLHWKFPLYNEKNRKKNGINWRNCQSSRKKNNQTGVKKYVFCSVSIYYVKKVKKKKKSEKYAQCINTVQLYSYSNIIILSFWVILSFPSVVVQWFNNHKKMYSMPKQNNNKRQTKRIKRDF